MNTIVLVISSDRFLKDLDNEFKIVTTSPNSSYLGDGRYEVFVMDTCSKSQMRNRIQNIYKRYVPIYER